MRVELKKFSYKYMEYEKVLLERELQSNFPNADIVTSKNTIFLDNVSEDELERLKYITYVKEYKIGDIVYDTLQANLEHSNLEGHEPRRQKTRYSTHGLHEYKGKYNPQIVHGVIDIMGISRNSKILDPFCGSGTTMLECAHYDMQSVGCDINPMAVFLSNTKIKSLGLDVNYVRQLVERIIKEVEKKSGKVKRDSSDSRIEYLCRWIPEDILDRLEIMKKIFEKEESIVCDFLKVTVSDLIREYSNQEPTDLRIRKRTSPFPETPFLEKWLSCVKKYLDDIESIQRIKPIDINNNYAILCDIRKGLDTLEQCKFDAIMTSPPYATALPYIDTQRISLVWLELCSPKQIMALESSLIGSREFISTEKKKWLEELKINAQNLPEDIELLIQELYDNLSETDGFRKQVVPILLYRYFADMKKMFNNTYNVLKSKGKFALVVGNNKTTLGGKKYIIDTPYWLAKLSETSGWIVDELFPLQTYKRYGLNSKNAIDSETLIILHKG